MKLGFIGCGKMAAALIEGMLKTGAFSKDDIVITDCLPNAATALAKKCGAHSVATNQELVATADAIVVAVKPTNATEALSAVHESQACKLIVSIMAGVPLSKLKKLAGAAARLVRVMPNTPALVQKGAAAYALGELATEEDAALVEKIFSAVGTVSRVKEELLDAVTGLSGSGPAFCYLVIEALADGGVLMGLPRPLALQLAAQTMAGAAEMALQTGLHPSQLKDMVTSPGGTTIAGIEALEKAGVRAGLLAAVRAATKRSIELGQEKK